MMLNYIILLRAIYSNSVIYYPDKCEKDELPTSLESFILLHKITLIQSVKDD